MIVFLLLCLLPSYHIAVTNAVNDTSDRERQTMRSVTESLEYFLKPEVLDGDNQYCCQACDKKVFYGGTKKAFVWREKGVLYGGAKGVFMAGKAFFFATFRFWFRFWFG